MKSKFHLSLNVSNVEESTRFYEQFFGVAPHKVRQGYANFDLESPNLKLALTASSAPGRGAINHLGLLVATQSEVEAIVTGMRQRGLEVVVEEDTICCHARQSKAWVSDPDGNSWEVYTLLDDDVQDDGDTRCCSPGAESPCCSDETCCA